MWLGMSTSIGSFFCVVGSLRFHPSSIWLICGRKWFVPHTLVGLLSNTKEIVAPMAESAVVTVPTAACWLQPNPPDLTLVANPVRTRTLVQYGVFYKYGSTPTCLT